MLATWREKRQRTGKWKSIHCSESCSWVSDSPWLFTEEAWQWQICVARRLKYETGRSFQGKDAISSNLETLSLAWSFSTYSRVSSMYKAGLKHPHWVSCVMLAQCPLSMSLNIPCVYAVKWYWERGLKGRGEVFVCIIAVLVVYISLINLWSCTFFEEKSSLSSAVLPWAGRKSCTVVAVGIENCSQSVSIWLLSPALVFTLISVTLLAFHWFDFNVLL